MKVTEQELKLLLDIASAKLILQEQVPIKVLKQTNFYFDTENLDLYHKGITLRIREENTEIILCIKSKKNKSLYITSEELIQNITYDDLNKFIENPTLLFNFLDVLDLGLKGVDFNFLGFIKNSRYCINLLEQYSFELDHSIFPNNEQSFELEVEGVSSHEECVYVMDFLKSKQILFSVNSTSKYERFLKSLNLIKHN